MVEEMTDDPIDDLVEEMKPFVMTWSHGSPDHLLVLDYSS